MVMVTPSPRPRIPSNCQARTLEFSTVTVEDCGTLAITRIPQPLPHMGRPGRFWFRAATLLMVPEEFEYRITTNRVAHAEIPLLAPSTAMLVIFTAVALVTS